MVKGDRVLIYMPMIAEAAFAMLALRAHWAPSTRWCLAALRRTRWPLASKMRHPKSSSAPTPVRAVAKVVPYKPLLDEAIQLSAHKPSNVVMVDRKMAPFTPVAGRDVDYATERAKHMDAVVPCEWVESTHPSYTLYTSGTTGKPKGVQRDTGGYTVALAASIPHIFEGKPGGTFFCTSDIGWVVGHSYIIYGPLIGGMATILYEGLPIRPDGGIWWSLVEKYKVQVMFSAPTAIRVLKKQDPALLVQVRLVQPAGTVFGGRALGRTHGQMDF